MLSCEGNIKEQRNKSIYVDTKSILDVYENWSNVPRYSMQNEELFMQMRNKKQLTFKETKQAKKAEKIINRIIKNVTHGELKENLQGEVEFTDSRMNKKIELSNLSSGMKIFAIIQTLLQNYSLKDGDILLVDEPEVNLHPEWQVLLADIFVQMYKELNIRMVINTHSPYFIRAIEVKMAEKECADHGFYYYMKRKENMCVCQDVTHETNIIYETLYKPLTDL